MKILVLSDSHGKSDLAILTLLASEADLVIHLGDGYHEGEMLSVLQPKPLVQITGNVDYPLELIPEKMLQLEGQSVLLTHGHLYGVKTGLGQLARKAKELGATLALFGHTHRRELVKLEGVTLFNPGSASFSQGQPSAGILQLEGDQIEARWLDLKKS